MWGKFEMPILIEGSLLILRRGGNNKASDLHIVNGCGMPQVR